MSDLKDTEQKHDKTQAEHLNRIMSAMGNEVDKILVPDEKPNGDESAAGGEPQKQKEEEKTPEEIEKEKKEAEEAAAREREAEEKKKTEVAAALDRTDVDTRPIVIKKKDEEQKPKQEGDDEFIKNLSEEQQEEIALAEFAESNGYKDHKKKLVEYYKKLDKWIAENPDEDADSEELRKFRSENEPRLEPAARRKLERKMISEEAVKKAREEVRAEVERDLLKPVVDELNQIKAEPVLKKAATEAVALLTEKREGVEGFDSALVDSVLKMNPAEAVREHTIAAPIILGVVNTSKEWAKISNGTPIDIEKNQTHAWLMQFIAVKENEILSGPKEKQTRDGKQMVRLSEFVRLQKTDPEADRKYFTLNTDDVTRLIAEHGVVQYNKTLKQLEKQGLKREAPEKKTEIKKVEGGQEGDGSGSPRASGRTIIGAADNGGVQPANLPAHMKWAS